MKFSELNESFNQLFKKYTEKANKLNESLEKYIGERFVFSRNDEYGYPIPAEDFGLSEEELEDLVGEAGFIKDISVEGGDSFNDGYFDVEFDNGESLGAVSGIHLHLVDDLYESKYIKESVNFDLPDFHHKYRYSEYLDKLQTDIKQLELHLNKIKSDLDEKNKEKSEYQNVLTRYDRAEELISELLSSKDTTVTDYLVMDDEIRIFVPYEESLVNELIKQFSVRRDEGKSAWHIGDGTFKGNRVRLFDAREDGEGLIIRITYPDLYSNKVNESKFIEKAIPSDYTSATRTVGIYGDEVPNMNSVKDIENYFKKKGLKVSEVSGDMDYGWEMNITGNPRDLFFAVVNVIPGYNSNGVEEFIQEYAIDSVNESKSINEGTEDGSKYFWYVGDNDTGHHYKDEKAALNAYNRLVRDADIAEDLVVLKCLETADEVKVVEVIKGSLVNESKSLEEGIFDKFKSNKKTAFKNQKKSTHLKDTDYIIIAKHPDGKYTYYNNSTPGSKEELQAWVDANKNPKFDKVVVTYAKAKELVGEPLDESVSCKESLGSDIEEFQKWVDYDMKKYGRISKQTNKEISEAGLKIVKDKYGDYEVIG